LEISSRYLGLKDIDFTLDQFVMNRGISGARGKQNSASALRTLLFSAMVNDVCADFCADFSFLYIFFRLSTSFFALGWWRGHGRGSGRGH
jgi:hypothetical protein